MEKITANKFYRLFTSNKETGEVSGDTYASSELKWGVDKESALPSLTIDALNSEAGQLSLQELVNLWRARWGNAWVLRSEIEGDFYETATTRLHQAARLESHFLNDGRQVFRLDDE